MGIYLKDRLDYLVGLWCARHDEVGHRVSASAYVMSPGPRG